MEADTFSLNTVVLAGAMVGFALLVGLLVAVSAARKSNSDD